MGTGISISMFVQVAEQFGAISLSGLSFLTMPGGSILTVPNATGQTLTLNVKAQ